MAKDVSTIDITVTSTELDLIIRGLIREWAVAGDSREADALLSRLEQIRNEHKEEQ